MEHGLRHLFQEQMVGGKKEVWLEVVLKCCTVKHSVEAADLVLH